MQKCYYNFNITQLVQTKLNIDVRWFTVAGVFGAACVAGELEKTTVSTFDAAVHPCNSRQLILILQSCLFKPTQTYTQ